jgi:hypothetical protein
MLSKNMEAARVQAQRLLQLTSGVASDRTALKEARELLRSGTQQGGEGK